jgi:molybdopterin/thiamine biosynthesis adenylyltransferase
MLDLEELLVYSKQICLPEIELEGQLKLKKSSVAVVGVGGLGCAILPYLAAAGIGQIGLIDDDHIELSNLARQTLFQNTDAGKPKVGIASKRLSISFPKVHFNPLFKRLDLENAFSLLQPYDLIIDATDNQPSRYCIDTTCQLLEKPWIYGSIYQWEGHVALFHPKGKNYHSLFPDGAEKKADSCNGGILGSFVGCIGMIQALEAVKWLTGVKENLANKLLVVDGKTWQFRTFEF